MSDQAVTSPSQGLTESQAVELLRQRRAAAKAPQQAQPTQESAEEAEPENAKETTPSSDDADVAPVQGEDVVEDNQGSASENAEEEPVINYVVDGKPQSATLKEAKEALSSVKHLNRLRNEIVEKHKVVQKTEEETMQQRNTLLERLQEVEHLLVSGLPKPQDMQAMLERGDTAGYLKAQQAHQRYAQIQSFKQQQSEQAKQAAEHSRLRRESEEAEELVKARPEFKNPDYVRKVVSFLKEDFGLDDNRIAELGAVELQLVDDARKWREWNRNKAIGIQKTIAKASQPTRSPSQQPVQAKEFNELRQRARGTGNMNDAIALLQAKRKMKV